MKTTLAFIFSSIVAVSAFGQIENFSWLVSRDGHTTYEVSDVYPDGSVLSAGNFFADLDGDPGVNDIIFSAPQFGYGNFIQKLNPDGRLSWVNEYNSGAGSLQLKSTCVDVFGNSYFTGNLVGLVDFDPSTPGYELPNADNDIFLLSLDPNGAFRWVIKLGGAAPDVCEDVKTDIDGNVYIFGSLYYGNADFDPGSGHYELPTKVGYDCFVEKLSSNGDFIWARRTIGRNRGRLEIDNNSNVYIQNTLNGFAIAESGDTLDAALGTDILIQKLNSSGDQEWIRKYGNDYMQGIGGIALDSDMNVYCQINFGGDLNVDPGYSELTLNSGNTYDVLIQKLNSDGSMIWTKSFGGTGTELSRSITVSPDNYIFSAGSFVGDMDFISTSVDDNLHSTSVYNDGYFAKFDLNGDYVDAYQFGAESEDYGEKIHVDNNNNVIVHGRYNGETSISTEEGDRFILPNGNHFLLKYGESNLNDDHYLCIGLSPNPVEHIVSIDQLDASEYGQLAAAIDIRIYDDLGRIVFETTSDAFHTEIDLSAYRAGAYLIEVRRDEDVFLEKVSKVGKQF